MPRNNSTPNVIEIKSNEVIVIEDSNGSTIEVVSNAIVVPGLVTATGEGGAVVRDVVTHTQIDPIIDQIQNDIIIERNARIETDDTLSSEIISLQVNDVDLQQEFENVRQTTANAIVSLQVKDIDLQQQIDDMNQANSDSVMSLQLKDVDLQDQIDAEIQNRIDSDTLLDAKIDTLVDAEIQNRINSDALLDGKIDTEIQNRIDSDTALDAKIDTEIQNRINSDTALDTEIDSVNLIASEALTLAQVNQLNLTEKADALDVQQLQSDVVANSIEIEKKLNKSEFDAYMVDHSGDYATQAYVDTRFTEIVDNAAAELVILNQLAEQLEGDEAALADFMVQLDKRVRFDAPQSLIGSEKQQARENIGAEAIGIAQVLVDGITPASIGAATSVQGAKADTALQSGDLAVVAFTNNYNDLSNTPVIPPFQVNSDWNSDSGPSEILNKPNLSSVAISGSYNDLTDKPTTYQLSTTDPMGPSEIPQVGIEDTVARADHVHPLPTSEQITSSVLTGLTPGLADSISETDTVLQAFAKLQAQSDAIYSPGSGEPSQITPTVSNGTYENGVLTYTGGTLSTPFGDFPGSALTVAAGTQVTLYDQSDIVTTPQAIYYVWHTSADASTVLSDYLLNNFPGLSVTVLPYGQAGVVVDGVTVGPLANPGPTVVNLAGRRLQVDVAGSYYETPETAGPAPAYLHIISVGPQDGDAVADAAFELSLAASAPSAATGLLPDETSARIAGDTALAESIADVSTLAQVNQLNILEKVDQSDFDSLQTVVTGQGITLAQKANQTALDSLATIVSGKATQADVIAEIASLVNGAPAALDTLSEIATALAGEQAQIANLLDALAMRVRVDAMQSLTLSQQLQARQNIDAEQVGVAANLVANITPASIGAATAVQGGKADTAIQSADLAPVAFSGNYSDLSNVPTIISIQQRTKAQYDALTTAQKNDASILYVIVG